HINTQAGADVHRHGPALQEGQQERRPQDGAPLGVAHSRHPAFRARPTVSSDIVSAASTPPVITPAICEAVQPVLVGTRSSGNVVVGGSSVRSSSIRRPLSCLPSPRAPPRWLSSRT